MPDNARVISAHNIQKTLTWGTDRLNQEIMTICELKSSTVVQEIVFDPWEQGELFQLLKDKLGGRVDSTTDTYEEQEPIRSKEEPTEEEEPKYIIIEVRMSGGKKKTVLNWCENTEEAIDVLQTIFKNGSMTSLHDLKEKVKVVRYSEIIGVEELWEEEDNDNG